MGGIGQDIKEPGAPSRQVALIVCCLVLITVAVFGRAVTFGFVNYDDNEYVYKNSQVLSGLTPESLYWAATAVKDTWQPVTWLSFMVDAQLGGGRPWVFHLTNVVLHAFNVVLLFLLLNAMTGAVWRSALVAVLFAVHPLRVESVAWVAERKDVLSGFFWLLTLWAYLKYVRKPEARRYACVILLFVLGLAAKPMVMTLPVVMLLLDYWPLGRFGRSSTSDLVREKLPLFGLALASTWVATVSQRANGAATVLEPMSAGVRVACAFVNYVSYLGKTLWPVNLGCLYPNPGSSLPVWTVIASAAALVLSRGVALWFARGRPHIFVGWLWYVVTLVPVIGLVQFGRHGIADRFTYIPHMGLFIVVAWSIPAVGGRLVRPFFARPVVLGVLAAAVIAALAIQSYVQVGTWRNSIALFGQALRANAHNPYAELNLASALTDAGRSSEAIRHCKHIIRTEPGYAPAYYFLGSFFAHEARWPEAEVYLRNAVRLAPKDAVARNNLGAVLLARQKPRQAIQQFEAALRIEPRYQGAQDNLDRARSMTGE